jgi:hypothetical protein
LENIFFFAILLSLGLDGFDQLLSFVELSLLSINTATSEFFFQNCDFNPAQLGLEALCYGALLSEVSAILL